VAISCPSKVEAVTVPKRLTIMPTAIVGWALPTNNCRGNLAIINHQLQIITLCKEYGIAIGEFDIPFAPRAPSRDF
jgi:hypothetical protein